MRIKQVNRYYCDHCNKGSLTKTSMVEHEARCARNPARVCGLCAEAGLDQATMVDLITAFRIGIDALRIKANGCPACMLSAILQDRAARPDDKFAWIDSFDYKKELVLFRSEALPV